MTRKEKYVEALKIMVREIWDDKGVDDKKDALQSIIDMYITDKLRIDYLCTIVFADLPDGRYGEYNHKTKEAKLRKDIAENGTIKLPEGRQTICERPIVDLVYHACHEARHAGQHYHVDNPEMANDKHKLLLTTCNNAILQGGRVYFRATETMEDQTTFMAACLYMLQPVEREAFSFAQKATDVFCEHMHKLFPCDPDFEYPYCNEFFERCKKEAPLLFDSDDPTRDIDNIILTINGYFVEEPLNEIMCDIIEQTQKPFLYELLMQNQEENRKRIEARLKGPEMLQEMKEFEEMQDTKDVKYIEDVEEDALDRYQDCWDNQEIGDR